MSVFAVEYGYVDRPDDLTRIRPEHRQFLAGLVEDGTLLASGPYDPAPELSLPPGQGTGALLLVRAQSLEAARTALDDDPFYRAGLIESRSFRGWIPVMGPFSA
jgi:uncharacterized protein YciI